MTVLTAQELYEQTRNYSVSRSGQGMLVFCSDTCHRTFTEHPAFANRSIGRKALVKARLLAKGPHNREMMHPQLSAFPPLTQIGQVQIG